MVATPSYFRLGIIGLIIIVSVVLPIVLVCVMLATRRKNTGSTLPTPAAPSNPEERGRRREAILEKLAAKTINREEAEQELLELDRPLPEHMPTPPRSNKGCGLGCLIGVIVMVALFFLLFLLYFQLPMSATRIH